MRAALQDNHMTPPQLTNIQIVRRYFEGCSSGDLDVLLSTLTPDVVHYFYLANFLPSEALSIWHGTGESSSSC